MDALAPVPKLDAGRLVADVNRHSTLALELLGPASGGEVGAAYVRRPGGREAVLTAGHAPAEIRRTGELLDLARGAGIPSPRYEDIVELPAGIALVQQRLPGAACRNVDRRLVRKMVDINERCAGLLTRRPDVAIPDLFLRKSGPGFCIHESLASYDRRTRRLLDWVRAVGADEPAGMSGDDLVHLDFHTGNVLADASGEITGIVDWDGIGRGDRRFALVTLRFDLTTHDTDAGAWLDGLLADVLPPAALRLYWAHMSLRMVDWAIRHHGPSEVAHWLSFAETRMR